MLTSRHAVVFGVLSLVLTGMLAARQPRPAAAAPGGSSDADAGLIAGPGRVEPRSEEVQVGAEVPGKVVAMLVDEGDVVAAGDLLARLEQRDYAARVAAAAARVRVADAELLRLTNGARQEERREADAAAAAAAVERNHARNHMERARRLFDGGVIPRQELEDAERGFDVAAARSAAAAEHAALVGADARPDDRARAEAAVALARASLDEARSLLAKTEIRAPIGGTVLRRHKLAGESATLEGPDTAIVTLADTAVLRVRMEVDERDVAAVRVGQHAWVRADGFAPARVAGRVVRVSPMLGRKRLRTDEPSERIDTKVLDALIELDSGVSLPIGLRVDAFLVR